MNNFFFEPIISELFKTNDNYQLIENESHRLEYKKEFHIDDDIFKTINAFANNSGGYIIYGVNPNGKFLDGVNEHSLVNYKKIDSENFRGKLYNFCQPNIPLFHCLHKIKEKNFIVMYICDSDKKPFVFCNNGSVFKSGDIFFRYNDSVKKILFPELNQIIEKNRNEEQNKWMNFIGKIAKIGLENITIIDKKNKYLYDGEKNIPLSDEIAQSFIDLSNNNEIDGKIEGKIGLSIKQWEDIDFNDQYKYKISEISNKISKDLKLEKKIFSYYSLVNINKYLNLKTNKAYCQSLIQGKVLSWRYTEKYFSLIKKFLLESENIVIDAKSMSKLEARDKNKDLLLFQAIESSLI